MSFCVAVKEASSHCHPHSLTWNAAMVKVAPKRTDVDFSSMIPRSACVRIPLPLGSPERIPTSAFNRKDRDRSI